MTEREKMLSGVLYDALEADLLMARDNAKELCFDFNSTRPSDAEGQKKIIKKLFGEVRGSFTILPPLWCDYGCNVEIGDNFFANHNCVLLDCAKITFGDNVFIAPDCGFYTAAHPLLAEQRNTGAEFALPITVGNNVWFGGGVKVLPGVTIGDGAVIGAGSVVTKDIPANVVAVGNPCRVLRKITAKDRLLSERENFNL